MAATRLPLPRSLLIGLIAGLGFWVTGGALTVMSAAPRASRLAVLPSGRYLLACLLAGALATVVLRRLGDRVGLLFLGGIVGLPLLPGPIPRAFLVWAGPLRGWLWVSLLVATAGPAFGRRFAGMVSRLADNPGAAPRLAGGIAAVLFLTGAWQVFPQLPAGDEPHYMVITQSLLRDHDLQIENNHSRGDYHEYYGGPLRPDYLRRGTNGAIYSIHAPGLPLFVLPVFAALGYPGVLGFLALVSGWTTSLAWRAAWLATGSIGAAWFGWATVSLTAPFFFQSFVAYPDATGAALVTASVLLLFHSDDVPPRRLLVAGAALAGLPWLHTRFSVLAVSLGLVIAARQLRSPRPAARLATFLVVPLVSAVSWFGFFLAIYGIPDPRAPYGGYTQSSFANIPRGILGLLVDQQFGVLASAPVYLSAFAGCWLMLRTPRLRRLGVELLLIVVPYVATVAAYYMWWGGFSSAARFIVPVLVPLAVPSAVWWHRLEARASYWRSLTAAALFVSMAVTATLCGIEHGGLLYNSRDGSARLLLWLSPLVDVTTGLPSLFQSGVVATLGHLAIWLAALAAVALSGRFAERRGRPSAEVLLTMSLAGVVAGSLALSSVWAMRRAVPLNAERGTAAFLRQLDPDSRPFAVRYSPVGRMTVADAVRRVALVDGPPAQGGQDDPVASLTRLPAGTYQVDADFSDGPEGHVAITLDREFGPTWDWHVADGDSQWRQVFVLPVPTPGLIVSADTAGRARMTRLAVRPIDLLGSSRRVTTTEAIHVARYGAGALFLLSGNAFMERGGVWVQGQSGADFALVADDWMRSRLFVRNPAVDNLITLKGDGWQQQIALKAGEERFVELPVPQDRPALRVRVESAQGARPVDFERGSSDTRFLGCWLEIR